ncbi:MAG: CarD family transcriptional regulator [Rickettsiales bacterium]|nr:CarD family transcriptional regulator [Rickettsiales bacterium]
MAEETQMIGDHALRLLVINFERDKMTLRVPMSRAAAAGLRPISSSDQIKKMIDVLKSKAKISRGMWSRRAQEYETKINSGNLLSVSEVVRDLHQNVDQSERSYSERMIYENALNRIVAEYAASEGMDQKTAYDKLMKLLRGKVAAAAAAVKEAA